MSVYHEELKIKETELLREVQADLPPFLREFFRGIAQTTSTKTRLASVSYTHLTLPTTSRV